MSARRLDASALRDWAHTAVGDLIAHTDEINRLNVFPVADADTGTNMLFTMRAAWAQADAHGRQRRRGAGGRRAGRRARCTARAATPGVILSQILRGLADVAAVRRRRPRRRAGRHRRRRFRGRPAARGRAGRRVDGRDRARHHRLGAAGRRGRRRARRRRRRRPGRRRRRGRRRRGRRTRQDHRATRCAGRGRRGGRRRPRPAGTAGRDEHDADRAVRRTGTSTCRRRRTPSAAATTVAAPQFEVMYLLSGCDARRRRDAPRAARPAGRIGGHRGVGATAQATTRCTCTPTTRAAPSRRRLSVGTPSRIQITSLTGRRRCAAAGRLEPRTRGAGGRRR